MGTMQPEQRQKFLVTIQEKVDVMEVAYVCQGKRGSPSYLVNQELQSYFFKT